MIVGGGRDSFQCLIAEVEKIRQRRCSAASICRRLEASRNRETGGTGLGLAIAYQLTLALGGRLVLANRPGGGLEARIVLPSGPAGGAG